MSEPTTKKWLFTPTGMPLYRIQLVGFPIRSADGLSDDGLRVDAWSTEELYESIEAYETEAPNGDQFIYDAEDNMFLTRHCRVVTVDIDFDETADTDENDIEPWDVDIITACCRVASLEDSLQMLVMFERSTPKGVLDNPITRPALDTLVIRPIKQAIETLEAKIAAYRAGRTEPESLGIEEEENAEA